VSKHETKQVFVVAHKRHHDSDEPWDLTRLKIRAFLDGHVDTDKRRISQQQVLAPDELIQLKFEALEHSDDEIRDDIARLREDFSELATRVGRADSRKSRAALTILRRIKSSFAKVEQARGVYVNPTSEGCEVVVTYPDSMRLGEALKTLVPIEIELSRQCKDTPIEFEYLPVTDVPDEVKSSYKVLLEHKGQESSAR